MIRAVKNIFKNSKGGDRLIYASTMILAVFGIIMIGSASIGGVNSRGVGFAIRNMGVQIVFVLVGMVLMRFFSKTFSAKQVQQRNTLILYFFILAAMLACRIFAADDTNGSYAWIRLPGGFTIQPAEFMKLVLIILLSYMLTETDAAYKVMGKFRSEEAKMAFYKEKFIRCALYPMLMVAIVAIVGLLIQRDFGTTFIICMIAFICFMSTPRNYYKKYKRFVLALIAVGVVLLVMLGATLLQGYQLDRITTWLNPLSDPFDSTFQVVNSLIAFSNGGLFGVGFGNSSQKFGYIPESHNDFISAIIYEELGLFGLALVLIPTCIIIFKLLRYSDEVTNSKAKIILLGISSLFFLQMIVNIGGVSGMIPMTGVPLLLISSGGSSTVTAFIAIGMAQGLIRRHNQEKYETIDTE